MRDLKKYEVALIWISGRDLTKPKPKPKPFQDAQYVFLETNNDYLFSYQFHSVGIGIAYSVTSAPNFIHRFMQRLCLGIRWEMLVKNKEAE